jgi:hypothetical protein
MLSKGPVFVVGVFRSGTSLLCSILNQNPGIALMFECDVWNFPRPLLHARFQQNWAERIEFYNQALSRHKIVANGDYSPLENIRDPLDLYHSFGAMKGAAVTGEKSPFYCDRLVQLHSQYPNASFIFVWRNPVEVYRSVLKAGQTSRFFGKPGMLSRMIYHQEQAIRQITLIEKSGARIFRVDYADLVEHTEKICRDITAFLGVPYDERMLHLNQADLSAIYKAPHHAYLRRGVIERQKYDKELVSASTTKQLERYRRRWEKLQAGWLKPAKTDDGPEPGPLEFTYHNVAGRALTFYDSLVRAGFEFLPLAWLRVYRLLKNWVVNPPSGTVDEKTSIFKDLKRHWQTILTASVLMAAVILIHKYSNPNLMFLLFYAAPCILLALVVNTRWATLFVIIASLAAPWVQYHNDSDYHHAGIFAWNLFSRFILLEIIILTVGRIRLEFQKTDPHTNRPDIPKHTTD